MSVIKKGIKKIHEEGIKEFTSSLNYYLQTKLMFLRWSFYPSSRTMSTDHLIELTTNRGRMWEADDPEIDVFHPKLDITSDNLFPERYPITYHAKPRFVCELPDCKLVGPIAIPFHNGQLVLEPFEGDFDSFKKIKSNIEHSNHFQNRISPLQAILASLKSSPSFKYDRRYDPNLSYVFPLVHFYTSYYHWIIDYLPKLRMLDLYEEKTGIKPDILIRSNPESFRKETLSLLGYSSDRIIEWDNRRCHVDNLILTQHQRDSSKHFPLDYLWLRKKLIPTSIDRTKYKKEDEKRIYISRQQTSRNVVNYDEMKNEIESRGFEIVVAESLSVRNQIRLFNQADIIMGPHGGGLTNMIFSEDIKVIELFPNTFISPGYKDLSDVLGFDYHHIVTESDENHNLIVNIKHFSENLNSIL